jgi:hypothetical protein
LPEQNEVQEIMQGVANNNTKGSTDGALKRVQIKRRVGSNSRTIKQMKDSVVRAQHTLLAKKAKTVNDMCTYNTQQKNDENPMNDTYIVNYDELVLRPDEKTDGHVSI